jgi:hypothetical protein
MGRRYRWILLSATWMLWSGPALAQDARDRARDLSARGQELYDAGQYPDAARAFEGAQALFPHPNNVFNAAKAWEKAAVYDKAAAAYRDYLDLYKAQNDGKASPEAADVERTIAVLKDKAFLALPEVAIDSDPPGADVGIDQAGTLLGQTPLTTHLAEGSHRVWLRKAGFLALERDFVVRSREPLRMTFALEAVKNEGGLRFEVNVRKARIYVDGRVVAVSPFREVFKVDAGTHQVLIDKDRYNQVGRSVAVETGKTADVSAKLFLARTPIGWRLGVGITSAVLGAGAVVTAATFLRARGNDEFAGTRDYQTWRNATYGTYAGGAALMGLGVGLMIWEFTRKAVDSDDLATREAAPVPVAVGVDPRGGAWVGAAGRF